ncbi:MAG: c-type cytochrome [Desulfobacteraceae bacterium]|jgi:mono/diheme cytochrome c family protein|nr:c-type cytochrome [Desulfobacteraceae bacterium]
MKRVLILGAVVAVVLSTAWGLITVYDYNMKYGRMWETPAIKPYEEPIPLMDSRIVPFTGGEAFYRNARPDELVSPFSAEDPDTVALGRKGYFTYCVQCHGKHHDGRGTVGQSFSPLPGDLRSARVQQLPDGFLFKEISYGIPGGRQPALDTTVQVEDRWRIIAYIKSLSVRKNELAAVPSQ